MKMVALTVIRPVFEPNRVGFNRDSTLPLQIHVIQNLIALFSQGDGTGLLQNPVG